MEIINQDTAINPHEMSGKNIYVISDLHAGDGSYRDNFYYFKNKDKLIQCIDHIRNEDPESIWIILGDFLEFWQATVGDVIIQNEAFLDYLADIGAYYVVGNHDNDLTAFINTNHLNHRFFSNMGTGFILERGGKRIMIVHGHETDPFNMNTQPGKGRMLAILAGLFEDKNESPILDGNVTVESALTSIGELLLSIFSWLVSKFKKLTTPDSLKKGAGATPSQNPGLLKQHIKSFEKLKNSNKFTHLVCGHTHKAGIYPSKEQHWYFNTGCWAMKDNSFVKISEDGNISVFDWDNGQATENNTVVMSN